MNSHARSNERSASSTIWRRSPTRSISRRRVDVCATSSWRASTPTGASATRRSSRGPSYVEALLEFDDPEARAAVERGRWTPCLGVGSTTTYAAASRATAWTPQWHVPHFEKMLSDQALLARAYLRAARAMPEHPEWREVALDTIEFVLHDLAVEGGFASALDADAGGVEGSHVTWTPREVAEALARDGLVGDLDAVASTMAHRRPGRLRGSFDPSTRPTAEPFATPVALRAGPRGVAPRAQPASPTRVATRR